MHREIAADAVTGAVLEIEAGLPEILPGQRIELRAGGAIGKHRARDRDMAAEHPGEPVAHQRASALPTAMVRVISVVPSSYCAPESIRRDSGPIRRLLCG